MSEKFRVNYGDLLSGWLPVEISSGSQHLLFYASYTPYSSLRELVDALISLLTTEGQSTARWNTESIEYDFVFNAGEFESSLKVIEYPDHGRRLNLGNTVFNMAGSAMQIVVPFWRQLRHIEFRPGFIEEWKRNFPIRELGILHDLIKKAKQK